MKNWEVEAILKFYKDIDLDIKVTHRQARTAHSTTGGRRHTPRTARVRRYCKPSERREGAVTPNAS